MNNDILHGMDGGITVQRENGTATLYGDRHLDGNEAKSDIAKLRPFARDERGLTGKECTCTPMGTYARGAKPPLVCVTCGGFLPRGLTEAAYANMRRMRGIADSQAPWLSLEEIALQAASLIDYEYLATLIAAKLAGQEPTKTSKAGA